MSEQLLQQILIELKDIKTDQQGFKTEQQSMKFQINENTLLTRAIFDRQ
ncbi:hypothetical protein [Sporosarcina sp. YIM B06819]|nr:hypothetical protein [Sporosarcina sp. YIM B06819]